MSNEIKQLSTLEHMKAKDMWIGSKKPAYMSYYSFDKKTNIFKLSQVKISPRLYNIIDEALSNATDHWYRNRKTVKTIKLTLNNETGKISIYNSGPGFLVKDTKNINGKEMTTVQMACCEPLTGTHFDGEDEERVSGGTNGAGIKLTNLHCTYFKVSTVDQINKLLYEQTFKNGLDIIKSPKITEYKNSKELKATKFYKRNKNLTGTEFSFIPDYSILCGEDYDLLNITNKILDDILFFRACTIAAYCNTSKVIYQSEQHGKVKITELLFDTYKLHQKKSTKNIFQAYCRLFFDKGVLSKTCLVDNKQITWEFCIGCNNDYSETKQREISIVNGLYIQEGGTHIKYIIDQIKPGLFDEYKRAIKEFESEGHYRFNSVQSSLFIITSIMIKGASWNNQTKDKLNNTPSDYKKYTFPKDISKKIWAEIKDRVMDQYTRKLMKKQSAKKNINMIDKFENATAPKNKRMDCTLFIAEGDSAAGSLRLGIIDKKTDLDKTYYGIFNIGGVPINVIKNINHISYQEEKKICLSTKLLRNERFISLINVLGLNYEHKYEENAQGNSEFKKLNYGRIIIATDQDLDGYNIFGLVMSMFVYIWPCLVKRGFIQRLNTPIIRMYPKNKHEFIKEFYTETEYDDFVQNHQDELKKYTVNYYKGLGAHEKNETINMLSNIDTKVVSYLFDDVAEKTVTEYYGNDPELRKIELRTSSENALRIGGNETKSYYNISITSQYKDEIKIFMLYNLRRKLSNFIDGFNISKRKVIYALRHISKTSNSKIIVATLANKVAAFTHYHHGAFSLEGVIIGLAQRFVGARNLPFLLDLGSYGNRNMKGKDHASARYPYTQLRKDLCFALFPLADDPLLTYVIDDENECEPVNYVPIIPYSLLESLEIPAHGWKIKMYARDFNQLVDVTIKMINSDTGGDSGTDAAIKTLDDIKDDLDIWKNGFNYNMVTFNKGKENEKKYTYGIYTYNESKQMITITDLPLMFKSSNSYVKKLKDYINSKDDRFYPYISGYPVDSTTDTEVKIEIKLNKGSIEKIRKTPEFHIGSSDPVLNWLKLRSRYYSCINLTAPDGTVKEYKKYKDVLSDWYPIRKQMYSDRIDRYSLLLKFKILELENKIKFCKNYNNYNIDPRHTKIEEIIQIMKDEKYDKINVTKLHNPQNMKIDEIKSLVNGNHEKCNYDYLINMQLRDVSKESVAKKEKKKAELENELKTIENDIDIENFKGANTWLKEINKLKKIVDAGIKVRWARKNIKGRFKS